METKLKDIKLGVIGCGKMAFAILSGVVDNLFLNSQNIFVYDKNKQASEHFSLSLGCSIVDSIQDLLKVVDVVLLAVKPFVVDEVMEEIKKAYNNQLVITILAGVKTQKYKQIIPEINLVRIMPNTPALVNSAMSAVCVSDDINKQNKEFTIKLMSNCGKVVEVSEEQIDIVTALSGSGPAFYYKIIDLMAKSATKLGLDYKTAIVLSSQTALGSALMLQKNSFDVEQLITNVTTPGGCTEVGNNVLLESDIESVFDKLINDTTQKAIELG